MTFELRRSNTAAQQLVELEADAGKAVILKAVRGALARLEQNPNHPGLNVHPWKGSKCPHTPEKTLFEAYAQNNTPGAYRIFFCYCVAKGERGIINIIAITPHP